MFKKAVRNSEQMVVEYKRASQGSSSVKEGKVLLGRVENFIEESKKCQTLYANCEGSYSRRKFNVKDKNVLEKFVYFTMYFEGQDWDDEHDISKRIHVQKITDKMIRENRKFETGDEIHFGVAWIYFFLYEKKTVKSRPVFKIYKKKSENDAVFLDVTLTVHQTWDSYLDKIREELPPSFLCVPKNGDYRFIGSNLQIEFVRSKKLTLKENNTNASDENQDWKPYCQVAVRSWLNKAEIFGEETIEEVKRILYALWSTIKKHKDRYVKGALFLLAFWVNYKKGQFTLEEAAKVILNDSLMLLNTFPKKTEEGGSSVKSMSRDFYNELLSSVSHSLNLSNMTTTLTDTECKGKGLVELLKSPKKNLSEILKTFCDLFRKGYHILMEISYFTSFPPWLKTLLLLLNAGACLGGAFADGLWVKSGNINLSERKIVHKPETKTDTDLEVYNTIALEKFVPKLPQLDKISSNEIEKELFQELQYSSTVKENRTPSRFLFLKVENGEGIFFIPDASIPYLTNAIDQLIGKSFTLTPEEDTVLKVVLTSGETVGTFFFPEEFTAVGVFLLKEFKKEIRESWSAMDSLPSD